EAPASVRQAVSLNYIKDQKISGGAEARNRLMDVARGEVWLFLDDDVVLEENFIEELLNAYERFPAAVGVSGVVTNYRPYSWPFQLWNAVFVRGPFQDQRQVVYLNAGRMREGEPVRVDRLGGGLMSFRAEAIRGFRFDPNLRGVSDGEDVDFCVRLGPQAILMMAPRARLVHNQSLSGRERSHWLQRDSRSQYYLYHRNWNHGVTNRIFFMWLNAGYALAAVFACARRLSPGPWRALKAGIRDGGAAALEPG
ncbi:MAG: glycosyltransferase family 2 protein, partial [Acidobacteriota bacterium]|nr:glycosyltransferase family 2 protein [Acidobacteriota bacterium]